RRIRRLVRAKRAELPGLPANAEPLLRAWAEAEIIAAGMFVELSTNGVVTASGEPRRLVAEWRQLKEFQLATERDLRALAGSAAAGAHPLLAAVVAEAARGPS